jgi:hypothetical protein
MRYAEPGLARTESASACLDLLVQGNLGNSSDRTLAGCLGQPPDTGMHAKARWRVSSQRAESLAQLFQACLGSRET